MIRFPHAVLFGGFSLLVFACSSPTSSAPSDSTSSADELQAAKSPGSCPAKPPSNGASCENLGLDCSYGDDPRFGCRVQAQCLDNYGPRAWQVTHADCPKPAPACPPNPPLAVSNGGEPLCDSAELGLTCAYGEQAFTCTPCSGTLCFQQTTWSETDLAPGCPETLPNFGDSCSQDRLFCNYNVCADDQIPPNQWAYGIGMRCDQGEWQFYGGKQACL